MKHLCFAEEFPVGGKCRRTHGRPVIESRLEKIE